jgi:hypothetical protein
MKTHHETDDETFSADAYTVKRYSDGIAWAVLGWETAPDEDTEWSGYERRTGQVVCRMIGDDRNFVFDPDDLTPLDREDYCGECGQIGCCHDGLDRETV